MINAHHMDNQILESWTHPNTNPQNGSPNQNGSPQIDGSVLENKPQENKPQENNQQGGNNQGGGDPHPDAKHPEPEADSECTVVNPLNRGFIDLRGLSAVSNEGKALPWSAKGYDSGVNFTLGICSSPMKKIHEKSEILDQLNSSSIGAYYKDGKSGQYVSIGEYNTKPVFRGRKLTMTYENGSYCNNLVDEKTGLRVRKSTLITLTCDREMLSKAAVSYIGNVNECTYMFEVRSHHVCPTAAKANNWAAVWIFVLIILAAVVGFYSGNILYNNMKRPKNSFWYR